MKRTIRFLISLAGSAVWAGVALAGTSPPFHGGPGVRGIVRPPVSRNIEQRLPKGALWSVTADVENNCPTVNFQSNGNRSAQLFLDVIGGMEALSCHKPVVTPASIIRVYDNEFWTPAPGQRVLTFSGWNAEGTVVSVYKPRFNMNAFTLGPEIGTCRISNGSCSVQVPAQSFYSSPPGIQVIAKLSGPVEDMHVTLGFFPTHHF